MNRSLSPVLMITIIGILAGVALLWFFVRTGAYNAQTSAGPGAYSRSALGYAGIADVLEQFGVPVEKTMNDSGIQGGDGVVVVGEPDDRNMYLSDVGLASVLRAPKVLLVLPKWYGRPGGSLWGDWITYASLRSTYDAKRLLNLVLSDGDVHRVDKVENWQINSLQRAPIFKTQVQLVKNGARMLPIISSNDGVLLGEVRRGAQTIWVLSDPDIIANHGLGERGEANAVLAVELIKRLRANTGKVIFAEGIHGVGARPSSPGLAMFQFPFYIVTAMGAMATLLLLWATVGRFGAPVKPPLPLAAGKQGLVENVARLMDFAGHHKTMIHRYVEATIHDVGRQLHAPRGLTGADLADWLTRLGNARGTSLECTNLLNRANNLIADNRSDVSAFVTIARDVYRWKQEIIDGPSRHTRNN